MPRALFGLLLSTLFAVSLQAQSAAEDTPRIEYTVGLASPSTQMLEISLRVASLGQETLCVALPVWRPGKYVVLDPAGTLREATAVDEQGRPLPLRKLAKSRWQLCTLGAQEVTVRYRIYANSLHDRTRHVDDTHAFLSGSSVFLYVEGRRAHPLRVRFEAPASWRITSGLQSDPLDPRALLAPDYDVLVDSPIEIGEHQLWEFEACGVPHQIAIWGEVDADIPKLQTDLKAIVETQMAIFGSLPYQRYVFLIHVGEDASGGTEHLNSTIMQTSAAALEEAGRYDDFLSLASHEFFHTWNVKQLRPAGISPYDYLGENYTRLLWVSEGTTTYYQRLVLARAGLIAPSNFLSSLSGSINSYRARPGRLVQSLEESSFDAWIKFNRSTPDDVNSTVSFYRKGALVNLLLDLRLRRSSGDALNLDVVMRQLYERFPLGGSGFTSADLQQLLEELSGDSFEDFFDRYVRGVDPLDFDTELAHVGLELVFKARDGSNQPDPPLRADLGLRLDGNRIKTVIADGPAWQAGLMVGDELVALAGRRVSDGSLSEHLEERAPGELLRVSFFRRNQLRELELRIGGVPDGKWQLRRRPDASEGQKQAYAAWIGQPW